MKIKKTSGDNNPTANLAINKSRVKKYGKNDNIPSYYLESGQEFQLELFNPTQDKVLTTIKINGKTISGGLILRPGERVFLDRHLQSNKRFLFDTYKVDNTKKSKRAIQSNGEIEIAFFKEIINNPIVTWVTIDSFADPNNLYNITNNITTSLTSTNFSQNYVNTTTLGSSSFNNPKLLTETGRVEEGSTSDQKLLGGSGDFEMISFHVVKYKLLPKSEENVTTAQYYSKYCGGCGAKCKTPYCSHCGKKQ